MIFLGILDLVFFSFVEVFFIIFVLVFVRFLGVFFRREIFCVVYVLEIVSVFFLMDDLFFWGILEMCLVIFYGFFFVGVSFFRFLVDFIGIV